MADQSPDKAVIQSYLPAGERMGNSRILSTDTLPDSARSGHASGTAVVHKGAHQITHACVIAPGDGCGA